MRPNAKLENCIQFAASVEGDGNNSVSVVTGPFEFENAHYSSVFGCIWIGK
jgi:hypothetical protein